MATPPPPAPEKHALRTPLGEMWLWGDLEDLRPRVLVISGAFAHPNAMWALPELIPEAGVLFGHIPGHNCPRLTEHSVAAYVAAYDDLLAQLRRPTVVCGASLGGVVAVGLASPTVRGVVALDPVLRGPAPELVARWRPDLLAQPQNAGLEAFLWTVFGIGPDAEAARDYFSLLDQATAPVRVLVGTAPARPGLLPSLVTPADRARLAAHPRVTLREVAAVGHDIGEGASLVIVEALREML